MKNLRYSSRSLRLAACGGTLLLAALASQGWAARRPATSTPSRAGSSRSILAGSKLDAATKIDFTFSGAGHQSEQVHLRDTYADVPSPYACFYHEGIMFGVTGPLLELRTNKQGPKLWTLHLLLHGTIGAGSLPVVSPQPALTYNGDNSARQQSFYPQIVLPPLRQGTLSAKLLPADKSGRLRGTFAGTLVTDKGEFVTISNGSFDLPRRPDLN